MPVFTERDKIKHFTQANKQRDKFKNDIPSAKMKPPKLNRDSSSVNSTQKLNNQNSSSEHQVETTSALPPPIKSAAFRRLSKTPSLIKERIPSTKNLKSVTVKKQESSRFLHPDIANALAYELKNRRRLNFTFYEFLYGAFCLKKDKRFFCRKKGHNTIHENYILHRRGILHFYADIDLVSILTTVRRMKVLSDLFFNTAQKTLEKYSLFHTIDSKPSEIDYFKNIPKSNFRGLRENPFEHNAEVNATVRRLASKPLTKMDLFLISQIDQQLFEKQHSNGTH
jgi:hypothetical protein